MDRYLITGFSGFIGKHFLEYLETLHSPVSVLGVDIDLLILIEEQQIPSLVGLLKKRFKIIQGQNVMHF